MKSSICINIDDTTTTSAAPAPTVNYVGGAADKSDDRCSSTCAVMDANTVHGESLLLDARGQCDAYTNW